MGQRVSTPITYTLQTQKPLQCAYAYSVSLLELYFMSTNGIISQAQVATLHFTQAHQSAAFSCLCFKTENALVILFVAWFCQGEPGEDGEAGASGPDGVKVKSHSESLTPPV